MTHEENWHQNFELLKANIEEHHHLPDKKKVENRGLLSWAKYQRKRIKAGALDEEKTKMFEELMESRSREHTGGKRKLMIQHFTNTQSSQIYRFGLHRPFRPDARTLWQHRLHKGIVGADAY